LSVLPAEKAVIMPAGWPRKPRPRRSGRQPGLCPALGVTFAGLGVPGPLVAVLAEGGITRPRPIQAAALPDALTGLDILGGAQTGSGKTLGFSLPLVARLAAGHTMACRPRGLVLVPTGELAT
jgi:superfamily II DNA/RNA helicase